MSTNPPPTTTTTGATATPYVSYAPLAGSYVGVPGYLPASTGPIILPAQARSLTPSVIYAPRGITPVASSPYRPAVPFGPNTPPTYITRPPSAPGLASNRSINFQSIQANRASVAATSTTSPEKPSNRSINFQTIQANRASVSSTSTTTTTTTTAPEAAKNGWTINQESKTQPTTEATSNTTTTTTTSPSPANPGSRSIEALPRTYSGRATTPLISRSYFAPGTAPPTSHAQAQTHARSIPTGHTTAVPVMRHGFKTQPDAARLHKAEQDAHDARSEAKRTAELLHEAEEARRRAEAEAADAKKQLQDLQQQLLLARSASARSLPYESLALSVHDHDSLAPAQPPSSSSFYTGFPHAAQNALDSHNNHALLAGEYVHQERLSQTAFTSSGDNPVGNPRFFDPAQPSSPSASQAAIAIASAGVNANVNANPPNPSSSLQYVADTGSNAVAASLLSTAKINPLTGKPRV